MSSEEQSNNRIKELSVQIIKLLTDQKLEPSEGMSVLAIAAAGIIKGWWPMTQYRQIIRAHSKNIKDILVLLDSNLVGRRTKQ